MKLEWSKDAVDVLLSMRQYYTMKGGKQVANKRINKIRSDVQLLITHPYLGKEEERLMDRTESYRSLISGDYKIIYYVKEEVIRISAIFDCRQDPDKIRQVL